MTEKTKIALSPKELELVCDKEWILTKHLIVEKVYRLFGALAVFMQGQVSENAALLPEQAIKNNPKISRGENYKGLPYVMLDYPRHFTKESTLAIRSFFWWGNEFSIHLHLSGVCMQEALPAITANFSALQDKGYWLCVNDDPWQHHFETGNYVLMKNYTAAEFANLCCSKPFIKIAQRISLLHWEAVPRFLEVHFIEMMMLVQFNYQGGETGLSPGTPKAGSDL